MTFLEVVFAMVLLGLLATTLLGATNFMLARQKFEQRTVACLELANRLILQFLDDRESMPDPSVPLNYAGDFYNWSLDETPLSFRPAKIQPVPEGRTAATFENFRIFKVRVWLAAEGSSNGGPPAGIPHAEISRMCDVSVLFRNPDSLEHFINSDTGRRRMNEGIGNVPLGLPPANSPGSSPQSNPRIGIPKGK